jgi:hypothetical protein
MTNRVDHDLVFQDFVEDQEWIRRRRQATNGCVARSGSNIGMNQEQIEDVLNPTLNATGALR